ncbi:Glutathione S-transferase family protein [Minicystis rosea]|nr:Glutathione S-transferase family protein [Minicystis rosea]
MTRRLFLTPRSPYARKVRIALLEKGLAFELIGVDFAARSPAFLAASPLGKVPALADEDGTTVFDSTVIAEYLEDRYPDPPFLGKTWSERLSNRALDELADTVADQAVAAWQARSRSDAAAEERAIAAARKALADLERRAREGAWPATFGLGDASVVSALGYLEVRHGRALIEEHPETEKRALAHAARKSVAETKPSM